MKRVIFSLLAGIALLATPVAKADNITLEQAKDAAAHYLQHNTYLKVSANNLELVYQMNNETLGVPSIYFFNAPECGWIAFSATTLMDPVVAFSDQGSFDPENMAPAMRRWLELYNGMVCSVQELDAGDKEWPESSQWTALSTHSLKGNTKDDGSQIQFLDDTWDQGGSEGSEYNMFCPKASSPLYKQYYNQDYYYAPVGCVATALAQMCHYYKYPKKARGSVRLEYGWEAGYVQGYSLPIWSDTSGVIRITFDTMVPFDYDTMKTKIVRQTKKASRREMSRLGYYVGIAVQMRYNPGGSSSNDSKVMEGMPLYFKYTEGVNSYRPYVTNQVYFSRLREDLMRRRPVYMGGASSLGGSGRDADGHAWLCTGYMTNDENMYYMNWGWGSSGNGYFNLVANDATSMTVSAGSDTYAFTDYQSHITGMTPPRDSVAIESVKGEVSFGAPYPNPAAYTLTIPYYTDHAADLVIYNAMGQAVKTVRVAAGNGKQEIRVDAMPSGIYIYRMGEAYGRFIVR